MLKNTNIQWLLKPATDADEVAALASALGIRQEVASLLIQRSVSDESAARAFLNPALEDLHDPGLMAGLNTAVDRILKARATGEKIMLFGDYDVDGTTSVTLVSLFFNFWGFDYSYYIPDRSKEGYGLSFTGIEQAEREEATLLITLDCGIKSVDEVRFARERGIDVIVCDHHTPGAPLTDAIAVLDPKQAHCPYPYKELSGCGVALKLLQGLNPRMKEAGYTEPLAGYDPFARYSDLVTLSIACDIVPITGENRTIAWHGLRKLRTRPWKGIKLLMDQAGEGRGWNVSDLVFFIGPRINAAGRLDDAKDAVKVLLGGKDAEALADKLQDTNEERKGRDKEMTEIALSLIEADSSYSQKKTTVLYHKDWHAGLIGIVASRLTEYHYRPTILFTHKAGDTLVGSARSVKGFDLYSALESCSEHLLQFGGHTFAAGMSMKEESLVAFQESFDHAVAASIKPEHENPELVIDLELNFSEIDDQLLEGIDELEPFGPGNRRPVFSSSGVEVKSFRILKEEHLQIELCQDGRCFRCIGFSLAAKWETMESDKIHIAYQPAFNHWNGNRYINLTLKDIRPAHEPIFDN